MQPNHALAPDGAIDPDDAPAVQPNLALTPEASIDPGGAPLAPVPEALVVDTLAHLPEDPVMDSAAHLSPSCSVVPPDLFKRMGILQMAPTAVLAPIAEWDPTEAGNSSGWIPLVPTAPLFPVDELPPLPVDEFEDEMLPVFAEIVGEDVEFPVFKGEFPVLEVEDEVAPVLMNVDEEVDSVTQGSELWDTSAGLGSPPRTSDCEVATPEPAPDQHEDEPLQKSHLGLFWLFHFQQLLRQQQQLMDTSNPEQLLNLRIATAAVVAATAFAAGSFVAPPPDAGTSAENDRLRPDCVVTLGPEDVDP